MLNFRRAEFKPGGGGNYSSPPQLGWLVDACNPDLRMHAREFITSILTD
jgi:hypothetical protein